MSRETKTLAFKITTNGTTKSDDGQEFGHLVAYGAVFNNVDSGNDRILPQAFKRTIKGAKDRAVARSKKYWVPMLWNHSPDDIIGGWFSLTEDDYGLKCEGDINLATQRGREYWELARSGMSDQFSIIYEIMPSGAKYTKDGIRELSELRLYSVDPVSMAMNDETLLVSVKNATDLETKSVIGTTSGPIGPRDESWDGSAAQKWIWSKALDDDDNVKPAIAKKYFLRLDGDATLKGSYSYPFWIDDHISVGGVKAIAAALSGSRGADAGSDTAGMQKKIETLYGRINAKYKDADPLTPPWKSDDGKSRRRHMNTKDFNDHYREECIRDYLCTDFYNLTCALQKAVMDIFTIGDEPQSDVITTILEDDDDSKGFISALKDYVQKGIDLDVSNYLNEELNSNFYGGYPSYYGYMSNRAEREQKAMTASDGSTSITSDHVDKLRGAATKAMKKVQDHADDLHKAADGVSHFVLAGEKARKAGNTFSSANTQALQDHADDLHDKADSLTKSVNRQMKTITTVADDLASVLQGSESAYGSEPGDAQDRTEGKATSHPTDVRRPHSEHSSQSTGATAHPSQQDTVPEQDLTTALDALRQLRTTTTIVA